MSTRVANAVLPWAAGHATVWPSTHAQHGVLLDQVKELEAALRTIAALPDRTAGSPTTLDEAREIARAALREAVA